jgi:hypothetical protein
MMWGSHRVSRTMLYHTFLFAEDVSILKSMAGCVMVKKNTFSLCLTMCDCVLHFWKHQKSILYSSRTGALFAYCNHQERSSAQILGN